MLSIYIQTKDKVFMPDIAFFIPTLGTRFLLSRDWDFNLFVERRNKSFIEELGYPTPSYTHRLNDLINEIQNPIIEQGPWEIPETENPHHIIYSGAVKKMVRLPAGTVLSIDRIYIRQGSKEYNSVSFNLLYCPVASFCPRNGFKNMGGNKATIPLIKGDKGRIRFWAKLEDVNKNLIFDDTFKGDFLP